MATLQKFKLLATRCAVTESPTRSPAASPVVRLRRRKTLRMLLNRASDRRRFTRRDGSREPGDANEDAPAPQGRGGCERKDKIRARRKLKELFVSSPPFEERENRCESDREGLLPATGGSGNAFDLPAPRLVSSGYRRPTVSGTFRYRLLSRAWRPVLVTIPEQ